MKQSNEKSMIKIKFEMSWVYAQISSDINLKLKNVTSNFDFGEWIQLIYIIHICSHIQGMMKSSTLRFFNIKC